MKALRKKSEMLTGYLLYLLERMKNFNQDFYILTPRATEERGCQLSLFVKKDGKKVFNQLLKNNIIADWREPGVIRVAPTPLYNTFEEVYRFAEIFEKSLNR